MDNVKHETEKLENFWGKFWFWEIFEARGLDLKIRSGKWGGNDYMQRYKNHPLPIHRHAGSLLKLLYSLGTNGGV